MALVAGPEGQGGKGQHGGCGGSYRHAYYRNGRRGYSNSPYSTAQYGAPSRGRVYYDQYGNAVVPATPYYNR